MKKKLSFFVVIGIVFCLIFTGCGSSASNKSEETTKEEVTLVEETTTEETTTEETTTEETTTEETTAEETTTEKETESETITSFGSTITFDGLEITFGKEYSFNVVQNQFSEYDGQSVVVVPVNVKNISDEKNSLNMFYYKVYGSKGTELQSVSSYFDNSIDYAGELRPDASYDTYFYFLYDGDGTYYISFDSYSEQEEVELDISQSGETVKEKDNEESEASEETTVQSKKEKKKSKDDFGKTITFDGLEITFGKEYSFNVLQNQFSEYDGQSVVVVPVNVKNISDEKNSLNMFYYKVYGSKGTELQSVSSYFDNSIDYAGELRPDASYDTNFCFLYDGDGTYYISFDNYLEDVEAELNIEMK